MLRHAGWALGLVVAIAMATAGLVSAGPAAANGYCGPDPTGATACPINNNGILSGSIASTTERDFYVFYVAHQTDLQVTIEDTEDARCSSDYPAYPYACGWASADLLDSRGNNLADFSLSQPDNGVNVPVTVTKTVARGTYYVEATGFVDSVTLPAIPYQLTVDGNPGVQWPPACIVPELRRNLTLAHAKHLVASGRCSVGAIKYKHSAKPHGDVIRLHPGGGSILPFAAPVTIWVSGNPPHRRHPHHK
jgi:hypothetical protein